MVAHAVAGKVIYTGHGVPLFAFAIPIICFLVAVFGAAAFVRGRRLAKASAAWPTVPGTITNSSVIEELIEEKDNNDSSVVRKVRRYQVDLRYAYQLNRRDYVGTAGNWGWVPIYGLREPAEAAASRYETGQSVTVYYDPEQPAHAVLEPGNRQGSLAPLIVAAIGAVFGAVFLAVFLLVGFGS